jgi:hypothetical protein
MEQIQSYRGIVWRSVAAAALPFVVLSGYLFFSRWPSRWFTTASDYAGLAVSVAAGVMFIATLPIRPSLRILSSAIYVPALCVVLFLYCFWFVGVVFGDWL